MVELCDSITGLIVLIDLNLGVVDGRRGVVANTEAVFGSWKLVTRIVGNIWHGRVRANEAGDIGNAENAARVGDARIRRRRDTLLAIDFRHELMRRDAVVRGLCVAITRIAIDRGALVRRAAFLVVVRVAAVGVGDVSILGDVRDEARVCYWRRDDKRWV